MGSLRSCDACGPLGSRGSRRAGRTVDAWSWSGCGRERRSGCGRERWSGRGSQRGGDGGRGDNGWNRGHGGGRVAELRLDDLSVQTVVSRRHDGVRRHSIVASGVAVGARVVDDRVVVSDTALVAESADGIGNDVVAHGGVHDGIVHALHVVGRLDGIGSQTVDTLDVVVGGVAGHGELVLRDTVDSAEAAAMNHVEALAAVARGQTPVSAQVAAPRVRWSREHAVGAGPVPLLTAVIREDAVRVEAADTLEGARVISVGRRRTVRRNDTLSVVAAHARSNRQGVRHNPVYALHVVVREGVLDDLTIVSDALGTREGAGTDRARVVEDECVVVALQPFYR